MTARPQAKRSYPSRSEFDQLSMPPPPKRHMSEAMAATAALLREDDEDVPAAAAAAVRPDVIARPRPARGLFDHVPVSRYDAMPSVDEYAQLPRAAPTLGQEEQRALALFDRQAGTAMDGQVMDLGVGDSSVFPATGFPLSMPREKLARLLESWARPSARTEFLQLLKNLAPRERSALLVQLRKPFEQLDEEYGPSWIDARIDEMNKVRAKPENEFASQVAVALGLPNSDALLVPSHEAVESTLRASLEERRSLDQSLNALKAAHATIVASLDKTLQDFEQTSNRLFDQHMPATSSELSILNLDVAVRLQIRELKIASQRAYAARHHDAAFVARVLNLTDDPTMKARDQWFLSKLRDLAREVGNGAIFTQPLADITDLLTDRARDIPGNEPFEDRTAPAERLKSEAYTALRDLLLDAFKPVLANALLFLSGGTAAAENEERSKRITTLLDRDIYPVAKELFTQTQSVDKAGPTAQVSANPVVAAAGLKIHTVDAHYWLLRPFVPGIFTDTPKPTIVGQLIFPNAVENDPRFPDQVAHLKQLYNTFGPSRTALWNRIQLAMNLNNLFIQRTHDQLTGLVDKPAKDIGAIGAAAGAVIVNGDGIGVLVKLLEKISTGESLAILAKTIAELVKRNAGGTLWHANVTSQTNRSIDAFLLFEEFLRDWEPTLILDPRFGALAILVRYDFVRIFLLDLDNVCRTYLITKKKEHMVKIDELNASIEERLTADGSRRGTAEGIAWRWQSDHSHVVLYTSQLNSAIGKAAKFVVDTKYFSRVPGFRTQPDKWVRATDDDGQSFMILFAEITAFCLRRANLVLPGIYLEKTKKEAQEDERKRLIGELNNYEYVVDWMTKDGSFRRKH